MEGVQGTLDYLSSNEKQGLVRFGRGQRIVGLKV